MAIPAPSAFTDSGPFGYNFDESPFGHSILYRLKGAMV